LKAVYEWVGPSGDAWARAVDLGVEQTLEFPLELAPAGARASSLGRVVAVEERGPALQRLTLEYPVSVLLDSRGRPDACQLLNVLFGNISLQPSLRLVDLEVPELLLEAFGGPRFGVEGLRALTGVEGRPLLGTALKPLGLGASELATQARACALGGLDLVKDDHGLCDQASAPFEERLRRVVDALAEAADRRGRPCLYFPNVTAPPCEMLRRIELAARHGASGVVLSVALVGPGALQEIASGDAGLPVLAHPAMAGALVSPPDHGIHPRVLLGLLFRMLGADGVIFPSPMGRFGASEGDALAIQETLGCALGSLRKALPVPAGGMRLEDLSAHLAVHGRDCLLLIGGDLRRGGDLEGRSRRFVERVEALGIVGA
jgi:ribulose-bisphosphate carboxylase large chain